MNNDPKNSTLYSYSNIPQTATKIAENGKKCLSIVIIFKKNLDIGRQFSQIPPNHPHQYRFMCSQVALPSNRFANCSKRLA
jgi:hypothetical protein